MRDAVWVADTAFIRPGLRDRAAVWIADAARLDKA